VMWNRVGGSGMRRFSDLKKDLEINDEEIQ
jgi:hypothetical protein